MCGAVKERILLVLWTTDRCNLKCKYCYAYRESCYGNMELETAIKAINYFKDHPLTIQFAGGEPLLNYKLIEEIHKYVVDNSLNVRYQIQTNGTLLTIEMARKFKSMNMGIGISLDGMPKFNEFLRGHTKEVLTGVENLKTEGIVVNINSVVTKDNVDKLPEFVEFCHFLGNVSGIGLDLLRLTGKASTGEIQLPSKQQLESALKGMYEKSELLKNLSGRKIYIREIEKAKVMLKSGKRGKDYCYASCGRSYVIIPSGDVFPCGSLIGMPSYYMGNIINDNTIENKSLKIDDYLECSYCSYDDICNRGCPSRILINDKDGDLDCAIRKASFEIVESNRN